MSALAALLAVCLFAPGVSVAAEREGTRFAQRGGDTVTPLRFLTREQVQCQDACRTRASQCHGRASTRPGKEACENTGMRCVENCTN